RSRFLSSHSPGGIRVPGRRLGRYRELPRATCQNAPNYDCCLASSPRLSPRSRDGRYRRYCAIEVRVRERVLLPPHRTFASLSPEGDAEENRCVAMSSSHLTRSATIKSRCGRGLAV